jgi:hypothetical protein
MASEYSDWVMLFSFRFKNVLKASQPTVLCSFVLRLQGDFCHFTQFFLGAPKKATVAPPAERRPQAKKHKKVDKNLIFCENMYKIVSKSTFFRT